MSKYIIPSSILPQFSATTLYFLFITRTPLNLTLPSSMCFIASFAFSRGNSSTIHLTSWFFANSIASSLSNPCPLGHPCTEAPLTISGVVSMGTSPARAMTSSLPPGARPCTRSPMRSGFGAVTTYLLLVMRRDKPMTVPAGRQQCGWRARLLQIAVSGRDRGRGNVQSKQRHRVSAGLPSASPWSHRYSRSRQVCGRSPSLNRMKKELQCGSPSCGRIGVRHGLGKEGEWVSYATIR